MFTGIIEELGTVKAFSLAGSSGRIQIFAKKVLEGTEVGDSIAVNGICLTVTSLKADHFSADVMAETVRRSSLRNCRRGMQVNLERAMAADGRFGGHIVSGHIDGTGVLSSFRREENAVWVTVEAPPEIMKYIVEKGSVCIDGISLTVAAVQEDAFQVSVIPHTGEETILLKKRIGELVNLENDIIGKYVEKFLKNGCVGGKAWPEESAPPAYPANEGRGTRPANEGSGNRPGNMGRGTGITMDFLREHGI